MIKYILKYLILFQMLVVSCLIVYSQGPVDYNRQLHIKRCERMDSISSSLMSMIGLAKDSNMLFYIIQPEEQYIHPLSPYVPQDLYSFFCGKKIDDKSALCYRIVFDFYCDYNNERNNIDVLKITSPVVQIDSVVIDGIEWRKTERKVTNLSKREPFLIYDDSIYDSVVYARVFKGATSTLYAYSTYFDAASTCDSRITDLNDLVTIVERQFGEINIKQIKQQPFDVKKGTVFPFVNAEDDRYYHAEYGNAYLDIVRTCKKFFRHHISESSAKVEVDNAFSFFNKLLAAVRNNGVHLATDYDLRYICYIQEGDLYSIATIKDENLHRILVNVRSDGSVFVKSNIVSKLVINSRLQTDDIERQALKIAKSTYCYSIDEPKSLVDLRYGHNPTISLIGTAYSDICERKEFVGPNNLIDRLDYIIAFCSDKGNIIRPMRPNIGKTPLLRRRKTIGYKYYYHDNTFMNVDINGNCELSHVK